MSKLPVQCPQGILWVVDVFDNEKIRFSHLTDLYMKPPNRQFTEF